MTAIAAAETESIISTAPAVLHKSTALPTSSTQTTLAIEPHLSHSQIHSFTACPRRWTYEKVDQAPRERIPVALAFGCAIHDVCAEINEAAMSEETIPVTDRVHRFEQHWDAILTRARAGTTEADIPVHYGTDTAADVLRTGHALVTAYEPPPGIVGVEQSFTVDLGADLPLITGRIDLIRCNPDGALVLSDLKTSGTRKLTDTHALEAQLGLYDLIYPAATHEAIVLGKLAKPTITYQTVIPWPERRLLQHYSEIFHAMSSGVRYAVRGWHCGGCPFRDRCHAEGA